MNWKLLTIIYGFINQMEQEGLWDMSSDEVEITAKYLYNKLSLYNDNIHSLPNKEWDSILWEIFDKLGWCDISSINKESYNVIHSFF